MTGKKTAITILADAFADLAALAIEADTRRQSAQRSTDFYMDKCAKYEAEILKLTQQRDEMLLQLDKCSIQNKSMAGVQTSKERLIRAADALSSTS